MLLFGVPLGDIAAGVGTHPGVGDNAVHRDLAGFRAQFLLGKTDQQNLVQARPVAGDLAGRVSGIGQDRRAAERDVIEGNQAAVVLPEGIDKLVPGLGRESSGIVLFL